MSTEPYLLQQLRWRNSWTKSRSWWTKIWPWISVPIQWLKTKNILGCIRFCSQIIKSCDCSPPPNTKEHPKYCTQFQGSPLWEKTQNWRQATEMFWGLEDMSKEENLWELFFFFLMFVQPGEVQAKGGSNFSPPLPESSSRRQSQFQEVWSEMTASKRETLKPTKFPLDIGEKKKSFQRVAMQRSRPICRYSRLSWTTPLASRSNKESVLLRARDGTRMTSPEASSKLVGWFALFFIFWVSQKKVKPDTFIQSNSLKCFLQPILCKFFPVMILKS